MFVEEECKSDHLKPGRRASLQKGRLDETIPLWPVCVSESVSLLWCVFNLWVSSEDRVTVSVTVHQVQFLSSHSKGECHLPSVFHLKAHTHEKRNKHPADIKSEEPVSSKPEP